MKTFKSIVSALGLLVPLALSGAGRGRGQAQARDRADQQLGKPGRDARPGRRHLQEARPGAGGCRHAGAGETIQPVISGSADIGAGVGVAGAMRAFSKGAPLRILAPAFTGTGDLYWYVKAIRRSKA